MKKTITPFKFAWIAILIFNLGLQKANSYDLASINYGYLAQLPFGNGAVEVYKNGMVLTPNGSIIGYKTNLGNIGVLEMEQMGENLKISWITYNNDKTISSQTKDYIVTKNSVVDLDKGFNYTLASKENEFRWVYTAITGNSSISFFYGTFFKLPSSDCFANLNTINSITEAKIKSYPIWKQDINATNYISPKIKIIYQTNDARYGVMEIVSTATNLIFNWITYEANGSIYSTGCGQNVELSYGFDLDLGKSGVPANDDIFWSKDIFNVKWIRSEVNTKLALLPNSICEANLSKLKEISEATIKGFPLTDSSIDGSDKNNQLKAGNRIAYKTPEGRYGIFKVFQAGEDMLIDRITYDGKGGVASWGCFERIEGTYSYNLDNGSAVDIKYSSIFWSLETATTRFLIPKNGTTFYLIDQPLNTDAKTQSSSVAIYPNPAKHQVHILDAISNSYINFYDPLGKQVILKSTEEGIVNVEGLKAGLYQINYQSTSGWKYEKLFIVQ